MPTDNDSKKDEPEDFFWQTYLDASKDEDEARPKNWEGSTTGILTFTGLFAATVAAFIVESYKLLSPDSGDRTNVLLEHLIIAMANTSSQNPVSPPPPEVFSASPSSVITNVFWFSSLLIALICALLSTLVQEWSRNYVQDINRRKVLHESLVERAFNHIYIRMGVNRYGVDQFVSWIVALVHLSVVLFACGLLTFLFPISHTVAVFSSGILGSFLTIYIIASIMPLVDKSCPYRTPVTYVMAFALLLILQILIRGRGLLRCVVKYDDSDDSDVEEFLETHSFRRIITRQYTGDEDEFLTHPRFLFAWDRTYVHIDNDDRDMFFKGLASLIRLHESQGALLSRLCADGDFMESLYLFVIHSYEGVHTEPSSSLLDPEIFELVALLSERMYALEVEHCGELLEGSALTSKYLLDVIGVVSQMAEIEGSSQLSARLCLARVRASLIELCRKAFKMRMPAPSEEEVSAFFEEASWYFPLGNRHANTILLLLTAGSYPYDSGLWENTGASSLVPLHDDDCCRNWRHALTPEGLAHVAACNVLTAIAHALGSTDSQRSHSDSSLRIVFGDFGILHSWDSAFQLPRNEKQKIASSEFVSVLRSAGLDEWLKPGSTFDTQPRVGPNHKFLTSSYGETCVYKLQKLARHVDFEAYFDRARTQISNPLAATSTILHGTIANASAVAHAIHSQPSSNVIREDEPDVAPDRRETFVMVAQQPLDHDVSNVLDDGSHDLAGAQGGLESTSDIHTAERHPVDDPASLNVEQVQQSGDNDAFDLRTVTIDQSRAYNAAMQSSDWNRGERALGAAGVTDLKVESDMDLVDSGEMGDNGGQV